MYVCMLPFFLFFSNVVYLILYMYVCSKNSNKVDKTKQKSTKQTWRMMCNEGEVGGGQLPSLKITSHHLLLLTAISVIDSISRCMISSSYLSRSFARIDPRISAKKDAWNRKRTNRKSLITVSHYNSIMISVNNVVIGGF